MNGHHHCLLSNGEAINETDEDKFVTQVREALVSGLGVTTFGFVCTYGCGKLHKAEGWILSQIFDPMEGPSHAS